MARDQNRSVVSLVLTDKESNDAQRFVKLRGLSPKGRYRIKGQEQIFSGALLMNAGLPIPPGLKEYEGIQFELTIAEEP